MPNIVDEGKLRAHPSDGQKHSTSSTGRHDTPAPDSAGNPTVPNIVDRGESYLGEAPDEQKHLRSSREDPHNTSCPDNALADNTAVSNIVDDGTPRTPVPDTEEHSTSSIEG